MKRTIKYYLPALAVFLIITSTATALVGDVDDLDLNNPPDRSLSGTASENSVDRLSDIEGTGQVEAYIPYQGSSSLDRAPSIGGPVKDRLTADAIGLSIPQAESYTPDESLNFVSYPIQEKTVPANYGQGDSALAGFEAGYVPSGTTGKDTDLATGSANWYYPGLVRSSNRFYVQTASGLDTVAGCSYRGYLALWADIKSQGNFFVYEWYPGESSPLVRSWGWSGPGYKKGWFTGDVPGWHTICYYCGSWSNYIYIYVYPSLQSSVPSSSSSTYLAGEGATLQSSIPSSIPSTVPSMIAPSMSSLPSARQPSMQQSMQFSLPAGAPTPPDIYSEPLALTIPDYNMYPPATGQVGRASHIGSSAPGSPTPAAVAIYPAQGYVKGADGKPSTAKTTTTCTTSTMIAEGVYASCPYLDERGCCPDEKISEVIDAPNKYKSKHSKAVYPKPSTCKCNEYYVLSCQGDIDTVAGVYCDEWIPLWSKISRSGEYWSYEWKVCHSTSGKGCNPEVRNFGYKKAGWYQTWFKGSEPGWHILSYHCNDWSNYIYVYVWPAN